MNIGDWVQRSVRNDSGKVTALREGKVHLVDSIVSGRATTRCGNDMERETDAGKLTVMVQPLVDEDVCQQCIGHKRTVAASVELGGVVASTPADETSAGRGGTTDTEDEE